jgi:hypothetical protein
MQFGQHCQQNLLDYLNLNPEHPHIIRAAINIVDAEAFRRWPTLWSRCSVGNLLKMSLLGCCSQHHAAREAY